MPSGTLQYPDPQITLSSWVGRGRFASWFSGVAGSGDVDVTIWGGGCEVNYWWEEVIREECFPLIRGDKGIDADSVVLNRQDG